MPQTQLYRRRAMIHVTPEDTVDTYKAPAADGSEAFLAVIPESFQSLDGSNFEPDYMRNDYLNSDEVPGGKSKTLTFQILLKGSGTAGVAPRFRHALLMAGMQEEVTADTDVVYKPRSEYDGAVDAGPPVKTHPSQSYSVTIIEAGVLYRAKGCFANMTVNAESGQAAIAEFNPQGAWLPVVRDPNAVIDPDACDPTVAPMFMGGTAQMQFEGKLAHTPKAIQNWNLDLGNQIALGPDFTEDYGFYGSRITNWKHTGSINPEMPLPPVTAGEADDDYWTFYEQGLAASLTAAWGKTAGNLIKMDLPRVILRPPEQGNRNDVRILTLNYAASSPCANREALGNSEFVLSFS